MIAQGSHVFQTARLRGAARVRRTHVSWETTQDVAQSNFIPQQLNTTLIFGNLAKILMRPRVACNLVSFQTHALDQFNPGFSRRVDLPFAVVVAGDKESRLGVILVEQFQEIIGVRAWTVVVGQRDGSRDRARANSVRTVRHMAKLGSRNGICWGSPGGLVGVTMTVINLTIGGSAMVLGVSTVAC